MTPSQCTTAEQLIKHFKGKPIRLRYWADMLCIDYFIPLITIDGARVSGTLYYRNGTSCENSIWCVDTDWVFAKRSLEDNERL